MNKALLDTDILSEVSKGINPIVAQNAATYRLLFGYYTTSTISQMEVIRGFQRNLSTRRLNQFVTQLATQEVLPFDEVAGDLAGRIAGDLQRTGGTIGVSDPMIAAVAISRGLDLVTGNTRHFGRIAHLGYPLVLVNWRV